MVDDIVTNEDVCILLVLVMLCAVEQFHSQFKLQVGLLPTATDLLKQFVEDGQSAIQQLLPFHGKFAAQLFTSHLLTDLVAFLCYHLLIQIYYYHSSGPFINYTISNL